LSSLDRVIHGYRSVLHDVDSQVGNTAVTADTDGDPLML
jgi:hypothetical protein